MASKTKDTIAIEPIRTETLEVALVGVSPYYSHRLSPEARMELLYPKGRKTTAERKAALKHDPIKEFRDSLYTLPDGDAYLAVKATAVKGAMMTAALDCEGVYKTQIGRLVYVEGSLLPLYGVPKLAMDDVRNSGRNNTPDIRTRAVLDTWAVVLQVTYQQPMLNAKSILNLLEAAGQTAGIGDWRPEKGKGDFGRFRVAEVDAPEVLAIVAAGGREVQLRAVETPGFYDDEAERLCEWFYAEVGKRGQIDLLE